MTRPARRHSTEFELLDALREPGCAICRLGLRAVRRFLETLAYEGVNDPENRDRLRAAHGFCNRHAWQWLREAQSALGTAIIYRDVLTAVIAESEAALGERGRSGGLLGTVGIGDQQRASSRRLAQALDPKGQCPACAALAEAEARYLGALLEHGDEPELRELLGATFGVCLVHLRQAAGLAARRGRAGALVRLAGLQLGHLERLLGQLGEVVRKHDYRFSSEPWGEERNAPARAVEQIVGKEDVR